MPSIALAPEHALAYLRELQPGAREVALLGPGGVLLAGDEGDPATAGRVLQQSGEGVRVAGQVLALAVGGLVIAAAVPDPGAALAAYDLRCVASAIDVSFAA